MAEWTDERAATLRRLWDQTPKLSTLSIGLMMGVSKNAVIGKAHRLNLSSRPSPIPRPNYVPPRVVNAKAPNRGRPVPAPPPPVVLPLVGSVGRAMACQWIYGSGRPWLMCSAASDPGVSWCLEHRARVFQEVRK